MADRGRPRKYPKEPLLSISTIERLPKDVREFVEEMVARHRTVEQVQDHLKQNGFLVSKPSIKSWIRAIPIKKVESVHDLPEEIKERVEAWWLTRRNYSSCIHDLAEAGYAADVLRLQKWYGELLRDEAVAEITGNFDPSKTTISKELEAWALTGAMDKAVDALMRSDKRIEIKSATDFGRLTDVLIKVVNANISRRKLDLDEESLMRKARAEFDTKIRQMLTAHPELVQQLAEIANEAEGELVAR